MNRTSWDPRYFSYAQFAICRDGGQMPQEATVKSVGWDIFLPDDVEMGRGLKKIPLGIIVRPPNGHYFELCLRSSTPDKWDLFIPHGFGIIDPDYCGAEDELILQVVHSPLSGYWNEHPKDSHFEHIHRQIIPKDTRLCQLILHKIELCEWKERPYVAIQGRRKSRQGFGATGK
jgi:dUTPase